MACRSCEERRAMIASAVKTGGAAGAIKVAPKIFRHMLQRGPLIVRKDKG